MFPGLAEFTAGGGISADFGADSSASGDAYGKADSGNGDIIFGDSSKGVNASVFYIAGGMVIAAVIFVLVAKK